MGIIVCKFGGTSTANAGMFQRIRQILKDDPSRRYVVLSAPGGGIKVTDLLIRYWRLRTAGSDREANHCAENVANRFSDIAAALGIKGFGDCVLRSLGMSASEAEAVSRGEYLCAKLFSIWSGMPFVDAADLVRFDGEGRHDLRASLARFRALASSTPSAVIPGFYGSGPDGRIATFPRNGSDITGALAAAGVGADIYENWSDVPGLMTADPAVDPNARLVPRVSYSEMRRLAVRGARVLHPDALAPVEAAGIPTRLCCTLDPTAPGTLVS